MTNMAEYIYLGRKWGWIILLGIVIGGSAMFLFRRSQASTYQAQTTLLVGGFLRAPNPTSFDIDTSVLLAQTYTVLAKTHDVLQAAIDKGNFPVTVDELRRMVQSQVVPSTALLVIRVEYTDPELAALIADEVAQQIILKSPTNLTPEQKNQIDLATSEIERLNAELVTTRAHLSAIDDRLEANTNPGEIEALTAQRNVLVEQINFSSATIAQFTDTVAGLRQRTNSIDIVERAQVPTVTSGFGAGTMAVLGAIVGGVVTSGLVFVIGYLDATLRSPEEAQELIEAPILGVVPAYRRRRSPHPNDLLTTRSPTSTISEAYRTIRSKLLFSNSEQTSTFVITSPDKREGKSITAANLGITIAQLGIKVLLIDANLREPELHKFFNLPNDFGLKNLLELEATRLTTLEDEIDVVLKRSLKETSIPNLQVMTSGPVMGDPTEYLSSERMRLLIQMMYRSNIDVILLDAPSILSVADSLVLSANIGGSMVLVTQARKTPYISLVNSKKQLEEYKVDVRGVVFNGAN
jgi:polysaccharide biosynthesis transport protein